MTALTDSTAITVRALQRGDRRPLHEVFGQMSPTARAQRYLTGMARLPEAILRRLVALSPGMHEAFVGEVDGAAVGIGRWVRLHPTSGTAEVALEVVDAWQGRGIGSALTDALVDSARAAGVDTLLWVHVPENLAVARLAARLGGSARVVDGLVERRTPISRVTAACA